MEMGKTILFRIEPVPIPSTHQSALSKENRPIWTKELKTHELLVLFAPVQTNGIGSHGRKWVSNKEDFHINLIFYADKILPFSQIAAYTACQLLARETMQTERFKMKWPNDVMVEDFDGWKNFKKIGGCLTAVRKEGSRYWVTVGIGINYNLEDFSNIDQPTTSVKSFLNSFPKKHGLYRENDFTRDELYQSVQRFSDLFLKNLALVQKNGLEAFYDKEDPLEQFGSKHYWLYLGQNVTVFDEDKRMQLTGKFEALTDDGALRLICDNGKTEIVLNGTGLKSAGNC
jgi:biotin-[acetyl-CoA-carboxylase] ligase BirA-like protein